MDLNNYTDLESTDKCQCITLDESGKITGSCNTLFHTSRLSATSVKREFPFLYKVINYLKTQEAGESPLFFPQIEFECNGYHSVCDFTFMRSVDALGIKRFIWMIYDNSVHYRDLISSGYQRKIKKPRLQF